MIKNILIAIFIILGMVVILNFSEHNLKRAVDACLAGSQKLSESKITEEVKSYLSLRLQILKRLEFSAKKKLEQKKIDKNKRLKIFAIIRIFL